MRRHTRSAHAILHHAAIVVVLVAVDEGVVHADVGQAAAQYEGLGPEALQEDLEVRSKERGVASLWNEVIAGPKVHVLGSDFRRLPSLNAVHVLLSIQLPAEIDQIRTVNLLHENHGNADIARRRDEGSSPGHAFVGAAHTGNTTLTVGQVHVPLK